MRGYQVNSPVSALDQGAGFNLQLVPRRCSLAAQYTLQGRLKGSEQVSLHRTRLMYKLVEVSLLATQHRTFWCFHAQEVIWLHVAAFTVMDGATSCEYTNSTTDVRTLLYLLNYVIMCRLTHTDSHTLHTHTGRHR